MGATMTIWYFLAYSFNRSTVGPGTLSAVLYHLMSCEGQKYGVVKISCMQRICTPCLPAFSMKGMCFSNIADVMASMLPSPSCMGSEHCMIPDLILRVMMASC